MSDTVAEVPLDLELALSNIRRQLQAEPQRYLLFGVFWWWVKARLAERFDRTELPILGGYTDPEQAAAVMEVYADRPDGEVMAAALHEYGWNARYLRPSLKVEWGSELVSVHDPDVEG